MMNRQHHRYDQGHRHMRDMALFSVKGFVMTPRSHQIAALGFLFLAYASPALAGGNPEAEKQKSNTVSQLYQMTYGSLGGCSAAGESHAQLAQTIADWRKAQPELFALMEASPYWADAKKNYIPSADASKSKENCDAAENMIQQFMAGAPEAVKDILDTLKK